MPSAVTENTAVAPSVTVASSGCLVIAVFTYTVSSAEPLIASESLPVTMQRYSPPSMSSVASSTA